VSNSIEKEIKERIALGTKAYYANIKENPSRDRRITSHRTSAK
jgi:hypothetical protein